MNLLKLNDTSKIIPVFMADATNPVAGKAGLTVTVQLAKNGAAFANAAGTVSELGAGNYYLTPASNDTGTLGPLNVKATAAGALDFNTVKQVVAFDPYAASNLGLTNLDAQVSTRSTYAGGDTSGTTTLLSRVSANAALASQIPSHFTNATFSADGVFAAAALAAAPTGGGGGSGATLAQIQSELDTRGLTSSLTSTISTNLNATVSSRSTFAGGAVASVTAPVTVGTNNDKSGYVLAAAGLDSIPVETGINVRQSLSPILAACAGIVAGAGTGTVTLNSAGSSNTARIAATVDSSGNRTAVSLTLPS